MIPDSIFPGWSPEASLLKVTAINQLYSTNIFAVGRMAEHIVAVMHATPSTHYDVDLVESIAKVQRNVGVSDYRHHTSFASKFAHFFVDADRFVIYDAIAIQMVKYHLGRGRYKQDTKHPYQAFVRNLGRMRTYANLTCSNRDLDHYLWVAGQYRKWRNSGREAPINAELRLLFTDPPSDIQAQLDALLPSHAL
jgi:hypothetical protein